MDNNLVIIIPTHNRQNYLNRIIWYYSQFNHPIYICDSTKIQIKISTSHKNINYIWCPQMNFYEKILHVINNTNAQFYALTPDDDFFKESSLEECYNVLKKDNTYSLGTGGQIFFSKKFNGELKIFPKMNKLKGKQLKSNKYTNAQIFWRNYQNILWSIFQRETILKGFQSLTHNHFNNANFIEFTLGFEAIKNGNIYVSDKNLNFRELSETEHWGTQIESITRFNILTNRELKEDIKKFKYYYKDEKDLVKISLSSYLGSYINIIKEPLKKILKQFLQSHFSSLSYNKDFKINDEEMAKLISKALNNYQNNILY